MIKELTKELTQVIFDNIETKLDNIDKRCRNDEFLQFTGEYRRYTIFSVKFKEYNYPFLLSNNVDGVVLTFKPTVPGSPNIKLSNNKFEALPDILKELTLVPIMPLAEFIIRYEYANDGKHEELLNYIIDDEINKGLSRLNGLTNG